MNLAEITSAAAAIFTTSAFVPQALKVLGTRETGAISLAMYALFTMGVAFWLAYGIMAVQWSIIVAYAITLLLASLILTMKIANVLKQARP